MLAFFRRQNGRAFFPSLPIAALPRHSWRGAYSTLAGWDASTKTGHFYNAKGQREIQSTLAFSASHEARRRMAVFAVQLAGICTRPASREALRRAAVERSQSAFLRALCAHSAQSGVKGHCPLREPRGLSPSGGKTPAKLHVALRPCAHSAQSGVKGHCPLLEEDADHAAVAFVDDLAESLLYFLLGVYGHPHQLVGKPLPDQFV